MFAMRYYRIESVPPCYAFGIKDIADSALQAGTLLNKITTTIVVE
jgi:hypothetical protein